jgi:hypothetical protein
LKSVFTSDIFRHILKVFLSELTLLEDGIVKDGPVWLGRSRAGAKRPKDDRHKSLRADIATKSIQVQYSKRDSRFVLEWKQKVLLNPRLFVFTFLGCELFLNCFWKVHVKQLERSHCSKCEAILFFSHWSWFFFDSDTSLLPTFLPSYPYQSQCCKLKKNIFLFFSNMRPWVN